MSWLLYVQNKLGIIDDLSKRFIEGIVFSNNLIFFPYNSFLQVPYFDLLVPTVDTVRFGFLLEKLVSIERSVLFTGMTGVGKVTDA